MPNKRVPFAAPSRDFCQPPPTSKCQWSACVSISSYTCGFGSSVWGRVKCILFVDAPARPVALRVYVVATGNSYNVMPGGLTRVASSGDTVDVSLDDSGFIAWARKHGLTLWASAADGVPLHRALERGVGKGGTGQVVGPIAVIVGNEGAGIRPQLNAVAAQRVAIPLAQGAESLNVAVAAGILLYEVTRGR